MSNEPAYAKLLGENFVAYVKELPCVLGRAVNCSVPLTGHKISRRHAIIHWAQNHYELEIISKNGAVVNGAFHQASSTRVRLESGSAIRLGTCCFYFLLPLALLKPGPSYRELARETLIQNAKEHPSGLSVHALAEKVSERFLFFRQPQQFRRLKLGMRNAMSKPPFVLDKSGPIQLFRLQPVGAGGSEAGAGAAVAKPASTSAPTAPTRTPTRSPTLGTQAPQLQPQPQPQPQALAQPQLQAPQSQTQKRPAPSPQPQGGLEPPAQKRRANPTPATTSADGGAAPQPSTLAKPAAPSAASGGAPSSSAVPVVAASGGATRAAAPTPPAAPIPSATHTLPTPLAVGTASAGGLASDIQATLASQSQGDEAVDLVDDAGDEQSGD